MHTYDRFHLAFGGALKAAGGHLRFRRSVLKTLLVDCSHTCCTVRGVEARRQPWFFVRSFKRPWRGVNLREGKVALAVICGDYGLLFIQVQASACGAIAALLKEKLGRVEVGRKHDSLEQLVGNGSVSVEELRGLTVVATVRNLRNTLLTYFERRRGDWIPYAYSVAYRKQARLYASGDLSPQGFMDELRGTIAKEKRSVWHSWFFKRCPFWLWLLYTSIQRRLSEGNVNVFPMDQGATHVLVYERLQEGLDQLFLEVAGREAPASERKNATAGGRDARKVHGFVAEGVYRALLGAASERFSYHHIESVPDEARVALKSEVLDESSANPSRAMLLCT